jgi:hypothetical protein
MPGQLDVGAERLAEEIGFACCIENLDLGKRLSVDTDPEPAM